MLRKLLLARIKNRLKSEGYTDEQIDKALQNLETESDRPILDWLANGGFEALIKFIKEIISLFG